MIVVHAGHAPPALSTMLILEDVLLVPRIWLALVVVQVLLAVLDVRRQRCPVHRDPVASVRTVGCRHHMGDVNVVGQGAG